MGASFNSFCGGDHANEASKAKQAKATTYKQISGKSTPTPAVDEKKSDDSLPRPGESLIKNTFDLNKDLELLKNIYGDKYCKLLDRKMIKIKQEKEKEKEEKEEEEKKERLSIRVMQFNVLADGLCTAYSNKETEKTFLGVDKECLQWTYRGIRLIEEIMRFEADIICIEECDQMSYLMKYLEPNGYNYGYQMKDLSPIGRIAKQLSMERDEEIAMNLDGVAIIYKTDTFEICGDIQQISSDNKEKVFGLAVPLKIKSENIEILFIVTHLKSTKSEKGEELRERQINLLLKDLIKNDKNLPIIFCCDLNANPIVNKKGYAPLCYNSLTDKNNLAFESVYKLATGTEPEYTTCKARQNGISKHVLDYIFIKNCDFNVSAILEIPEIDDQSTDKLIPNWYYPSDHFSILAEFTWK